MHPQTSACGHWADSQGQEESCHQAQQTPLQHAITELLMASTKCLLICTLCLHTAHAGSVALPRIPVVVITDVFAVDNAQNRLLSGTCCTNLCRLGPIVQASRAGSVQCRHAIDIPTQTSANTVCVQLSYTPSKGCIGSLCNLMQMTGMLAEVGQCFWTSLCCVVRSDGVRRIPQDAQSLDFSRPGISTACASKLSRVLSLPAVMMLRPS